LDFIAKMNFQPLLHKIIKLLGLGNYAGNFEGIPYFTSSVGEIKNRAALALPGIGIFIHADDVNNLPLLRHEYGHMLQAKKWGNVFFYRSISWTSMNSARKSNHDPQFIHQHTWTEWTANRLSYDFFKQPADWDMKAYPVQPPEVSRVGSGLPLRLELVKGNR
jgi:hypothetical protein